MRKYIGSLVGLVSLAFPVCACAEPTPTQASQSKKASIVRLDPISDWNIDYGEGRCRLARAFGAKTSPHLLYFEQSIPSSSFSLAMGGPEVGPFRSSRKTRVGMIDDLPMQKIGLTSSAELKSFGPAILISSFTLLNESADETGRSRNESNTNATEPKGLPSLKLDQAKRARRVTLARGNRVLSFETGSMKSPFKALNACTASLIESWGFDPKAPRPTRPAQLINLDEVSKNVSRRYPRKAIRKRQSALFKVFVIIEADGSVSSCKLQKTTTADALESPACEIFKAEAKFEPALGKDGQPMRSWFSSIITYRIN